MNSENSHRAAPTLANNTLLGPYRIQAVVCQDRLGAVYRARLEGVHEPILLRTLEVNTFDDRVSTWLERSPSLTAVASAEDVGLDKGRIYIARLGFEGHSLARLLRLGSELDLPLPSDLALMVAQRIADEFESPEANGKLQAHGFLVPEMVVISAEGVPMVLGRGIGRLLCRAAVSGSVLERSRGYLSPEVLAGRRPELADDIYSASAMLLEMLVGQSLDLDSQPDLDALLHGARLAAEDRPLSATTIEILETGLAPRTQRFRTWDDWRAALQKLVVEGWHSPTPSALAAYMRAIPPEPQVAVESPPAQQPRARRQIDPIDVDTLPSEAVAAADPAPDERPSRSATATHVKPSAAIFPVELPTPPWESAGRTGTASLRVSTRDDRQSATRPQGRALRRVASIALLLLSLALVWAIFDRRVRSSNEARPAAPHEEPSGAVRVEPTAAAAATLETGDVSPTRPLESLPGPPQPLPEELLVRQEASAPDSEPGPDQQLPLPDELGSGHVGVAASSPSSASAASAAPTTSEPSHQQAATAAAPTPSRAELPPPRARRPQRLGGEPSATPATRVRDESNTGSATDTQDRAVQTSPSPGTSREPVDTSPGASDNSTATPETPAATLTPPRLISMERPPYPLRALRTRIEGTVVADLVVDTQGRVVEVTLVESVGGRSGLDEAARQAFSEATFEPAMLDGVPARATHRAAISFRLTD